MGQGWAGVLGGDRAGIPFGGRKRKGEGREEGWEVDVEGAGFREVSGARLGRGRSRVGGGVGRDRAGDGLGCGWEGAGDVGRRARLRLGVRGGAQRGRGQGRWGGGPGWGWGRGARGGWKGCPSGRRRAPPALPPRGKQTA